MEMPISFHFATVLMAMTISFIYPIQNYSSILRYIYQSNRLSAPAILNCIFMSFRINYIHTILFNILLLSSCSEATNSSEGNESTEKSPTPTATVDYSSIAKIICDCSQPSIALNQEMAKLQEEGKREEFVAKAEQVAETFKNVVNCVLEKKGEFSSATLDPDQTLSAIMDNCPNIPKRLADSLSKIDE